MVDLVHKELSYKIIGILFEIHNQLGNRYQEKYYQRAIEQSLQEEKIGFKREVSVGLVFKDKNIGRFFLDFFIEDSIILEVKTIPYFMPKDFKQVLAYLKAKNVKLGILANFRTESLTYKRILNSHYRDPDISINSQ